MSRCTKESTRPRGLSMPRASPSPAGWATGGSRRTPSATRRSGRTGRGITGPRLRPPIGVTMPRVYGAEYDHHLALTRVGLGEDAFAAAWDAGQTLTLGEAIQVGLEDRTA